MRKIVAFLILTAAMLCAAGNVPEPYDDLKRAEYQRKEGALFDAHDTLARVAATVPNRDSIKASLDTELKHLAHAFLESRESGHAMLTAELITDEAARNDLLLHILRLQCDAVYGEQAEKMIGKAEKTLALLGENYRDKGRAEIICAYLRGGKIDKAEETRALITDEKLRDWGYMTIGIAYVRRDLGLATEFLDKMEDREVSDKRIVMQIHISYASPQRYAKTSANERYFQNMISLVKSPLRQAEAKMSLANFYAQASRGPAKEDEISVDESWQNRRRSLREAVELLRPLPGSFEKTLVLIDIIQCYERFKETGEAQAAEQVLLESVTAIEDGELMFKCVQRMDPTRFSRWRPGEEAVYDFLVRLKDVVEAMPGEYTSSSSKGQRSIFWGKVAYNLTGSHYRMFADLTPPGK